MCPVQWEDLSFEVSSDNPVQRGPGLMAWPWRILQCRTEVGRIEQTQLSGGDRLSQDGAGWEGTAKKYRSNEKLAAAAKLS